MKLFVATVNNLLLAPMQLVVLFQFFTLIRIISSSRGFGGVMSKIEFEQNWRYGYVLYYRKQVK